MNMKMMRAIITTMYAVQPAVIAALCGVDFSVGPKLGYIYVACLVAGALAYAFPLREEK